MGGFKNKSNNIIYKRDLFTLIVSHISKCCERMRSDCKDGSCVPLFNHEDKISNRLVEQYLNNNPFQLRFILQMPVNYDDKSDTHKGRPDIAVGLSDWLGHPKKFYYIEAKRIDGNRPLNKKYVTEGVFRFADSSSPKYPSYRGKNIMLGYVVQAIDVVKNVGEIDKLQRELLVGVSVGNMEVIFHDKKGFSQYKCLYQTSSNFSIELTHLFYDFSDIMEELPA